MQSSEMTARRAKNYLFFYQNNIGIDYIQKENPADKHKPA